MCSGWRRHPGWRAGNFFHLLRLWDLSSQLGESRRPAVKSSASPNPLDCEEFPCCYNSTAFSEPRVIPAQGVHQLYCSDQAKAGAGAGLCKGRTAEAHEAIPERLVLPSKG